MSDITESFEDFMFMKDNISDFSLSLLELFVVLLYDQTSDLRTIKDGYLDRSQETWKTCHQQQAALKQHIKRASYRAHLLEFRMHNFLVQQKGWWKDTTRWHPLWIILPEASQSCHELIHCACKKGCTARCKSFIWYPI